MSRPLQNNPEQASSKHKPELEPFKTDPFMKEACAAKATATRPCAGAAGGGMRPAVPFGTGAAPAATLPFAWTPPGYFLAGAADELAAPAARST